MRFIFNPFTSQLDAFGTGSGSTSLDFLTGNSGGAVGADTSYNINLLGDNATGINTIGNGSPNTMTIYGLASSTTQVGTTRLATNAEAAAQTLGTIALTPANITSLFSTSYLPATQGGTGLSSPTAHSLIVANGASAFTVLGVATNGQIPIGSTGADPVLATLSSGSGIAISNAAGSITISASGSGLAWSEKSGAFAAVASDGYLITATANGTLPSGGVDGETIVFVVDTTDVLTITANTGDFIRIGAVVSLAAGTAVSTARGDSLTLTYHLATLSWIARSVVGNWTIT